jgi:hypothetical protein
MPKEDGKVKWYLTPIGVVLLLFLVLGPFGLPLLYESPRFSKTMKIILTMAVVIYTSDLVFTSIKIGGRLYGRMVELQDMLKQSGLSA